MVRPGGSLQYSYCGPTRSGTKLFIHTTLNAGSTRTRMLGTNPQTFTRPRVRHLEGTFPCALGTKCYPHVANVYKAYLDDADLHPPSLLHYGRTGHNRSSQLNSTANILYQHPDSLTTLGRDHLLLYPRILPYKPQMISLFRPNAGAIVLTPYPMRGDGCEQKHPPRTINTSIHEQ